MNSKDRQKLLRAEAWIRHLVYLHREASLDARALGDLMSALETGYANWQPIDMAPLQFDDEQR